MAPEPVHDAWMETCLITIAKLGEDDIQFAGLTENIEFDMGEKDITGVALVNGGRVAEWTPETDTTITFEAYPLQAGTSSGATATGLFDLKYSEDDTAPISISADRNRDKHRISILWTNDDTVTSANGATAQDYSGMRFSFANVYITNVEPDFSDKVLKFTVTAKVTPFDKAADANMVFQSAAGTGATDVLPIIGAYTSANKFGNP